MTTFNEYLQPHIDNANAARDDGTGISLDHKEYIMRSAGIPDGGTNIDQNQINIIKKNLLMYEGIRQRCGYSHTEGLLNQERQLETTQRKNISYYNIGLLTLVGGAIALFVLAIVSGFLPVSFGFPQAYSYLGPTIFGFSTVASIFAGYGLRKVSRTNKKNLEYGIIEKVYNKIKQQSIQFPRYSYKKGSQAHQASGQIAIHQAQLQQILGFQAQSQPPQSQPPQPQPPQPQPPQPQPPQPQPPQQQQTTILQYGSAQNLTPTQMLGLQLHPQYVDDIYSQVPSDQGNLGVDQAQSDPLPPPQGATIIYPPSNQAQLPLVAGALPPVAEGYALQPPFAAPVGYQAQPTVTGGYAPPPPPAPVGYQAQPTVTGGYAPPPPAPGVAWSQTPATTWVAGARPPAAGGAGAGPWLSAASANWASPSAAWGAGAGQPDAGGARTEAPQSRRPRLRRSPQAHTGRGSATTGREDGR